MLSRQASWLSTRSNLCLVKTSSWISNSLKSSLIIRSIDWIKTYRIWAQPGRMASNTPRKASTRTCRNSNHLGKVPPSCLLPKAVAPLTPPRTCRVTLAILTASSNRDWRRRSPSSILSRSSVALDMRYRTASARQVTTRRACRTSR